MFETLLTGLEVRAAIGLFLTLLFGYLIGSEREARGKSAGVGTTSFVIGGAFLFTLASQFLDPNSPSRMAAYIVAGVGFIGAGLIMKDSTSSNVHNLTTAAEIWFSSSIGILIGMEWYLIASLATLFSFIILKVPHVVKKNN